MLVIALATIVDAQPLGPAPPATATATLSSASCPGTGCVALKTSGGYGSFAVQVTGTWVGTLTFEGSVDNVTFQPVNVTLTNGSSTVTTATGNGVWAGSVAGLTSIQTRFSAYSSGSAVVTVVATPSGGGGGGGGGGGAASSVTINDPSVTSQKAAVNASGQLSITCANCSGSGASAVDNSAFTAGTTSGAPAMGFFHSTIDTVTDGDTAAVAIDSKRNQFGVIRDAALNARGANVTAGNALVVDGSASTQPVSGTVGVSGTVTVTPAGGATFTTRGTTVTQQAFASLQSGATANGNGGVAGISNGYGTVVLDVQCTTCSGGTTINFEAAGPDLNFVPIFATQLGTNTVATTTTQAGNSVWTANVTALTQIRARISSYSAGTITVDAVAEAMPVTASAVNANVIGTVPVSGTVTTTPPSNASTNVAQLAGTTTSVNSGTKDAGTLRVVLATDQPALTNKLLVTPDSVALPANQSVNVSQINAVTPLMGNGTTGTGSQRVTIASDNTAFSVNAAVSGTVTTSPPANATTNVTQFGGVNVSTGTGAGGTGIPRVTVSNDSTVGLVAGSAVIGHVIADTGSTTAVTGNVTVAQATGTNLHAVLDTTSTTAVTQATGTNLHAVTDTGSTTAVTGNVTVVQGTGTSLHAVLDTTSTTAATQATAANLNAQVQGPAASGATKSGNPLQDGGVFNTTQPTVTTGQAVEAQYTARGAAIVATGVDAFTVGLPALASTSTKQSDGTQKTQLVDGSGNVIASTSNNLNVQCANCSGSGASAVDQAAFTAGSSVFAPSGGEFNDSAASLATGTQGMSRLTANRAEHVNLRDALGQEKGVPTNPEIVADLTVAQLLAQIQKQGTRLSGTFGRSISSTGDALDINLRYADPCSSAAKASVPISQTASTRILLGPSRRVFICSVMVVGADAENIALVEGVGTTCGTGTVGIIGGTTAATGPNLAANGGFSLGGGMGAVAIGDGVDICLLQSGAGRVAGTLTYALAQ